MYTINRNSAIRWIAQYELAHMDESRREHCLVGMWLTSDSDMYYMLSDELKNELDNMDEFSEVPHPRWNPLILEYVINYELQGVSNHYLKKKLVSMGIKDDFKVIGEISPNFLEKCDCCGYLVPCRTCPVCGWTDTKIDSESDYGIKNKGMTLSTARMNFAKTENHIGDPAFSDSLERDTPERFERFEKS